MASEADLMNSAWLRLSEAGHTMFRINVGTGRTVDGRFFRTGVPKGHPDLYGYTANGRTIYVETKLKPRHPTREQCLFLLHALSKGCLAGVAYTVEDALGIAAGTIHQEEWLKNELAGYGNRSQ